MIFLSASNQILRGQLFKILIKILEKKNLYSTTKASNQSSDKKDTCVSILDIDGPKHKETETMLDDILVKKIIDSEQIRNDRKYVKKVLVNINYDLLENNHCFYEK